MIPSISGTRLFKTVKTEQWQQALDIWGRRDGVMLTGHRLAENVGGDS